MAVTVTAPPTVVVSPTGVQGPRGNATLNGTGAPASTVGIDGDYYVDTTSYPTSVVLYGPKAAGAWPATGVNIGASAGSTPTGPAGGALTGTYPNPALAAATTNLFDAAGAAAAAQAAAIAAIPPAATTVTTATTYGQASATGTGTNYARQDHAHGTPTLPTASVSVAGVVQLDGTAADIAALGTQAAGATGKAADAGHVHPTTGVLPLAGGTMTGTTNAILANGTAVAEASQVSLDTFDRYRRDASGRQDWGSGAAARDANLYRSGAGALATDGALNVGTTLTVGGTPLWTPAKQGLKGWTYDPVIISANAAAAVAGTFYLSLIELTDSSTLTTLYWDVAVIAAGVTAGQNFVCIVNPSGTIVSSVGVDADIIATGLKTTTISVPYTPGQWRVGFLFNATTPPSLARCGAVAGSVNAVNANITGAALRGAVNGTGLTALPASVTLSANGSGSFHWAAVK